MTQLILVWNTRCMDPVISPSQVPSPEVEQQTPQPPPKQVNKSKLPLILIILGILGIVFFSIPAINIMVQVLPKIGQLGEQTHLIGFNPIASYAIVGLIALIPIAQILYGLILINAQKNGVLKATQKRNAKTLIVIGIISATISVPAVVMTVILPIYDTVSAIR